MHAVMPARESVKVPSRSNSTVGRERMGRGLAGVDRDLRPHGVGDEALLVGQVMEMVNLLRARALLTAVGDAGAQCHLAHPEGAALVLAQHTDRVVLGP